MRTDNGGMFWETVFDVVSLAFSVADVIANPSDPWAWAGLIGDAVDVLVPFVSGVGETTKALKVANKVDDVVDAVDDVHDTAKVVNKATDINSKINVKKSLSFSQEQQIVLDFAKQYKKTGISRGDADALWELSQEVGLTGKRYHGPKFDSYQNGTKFHLKINGMHINIFD